MYEVLMERKMKREEIMITKLVAGAITYLAHDRGLVYKERMKNAPPNENDWNSVLVYLYLHIFICKSYVRREDTDATHVCM